MASLDLGEDANRLDLISVYLTGGGIERLCSNCFGSKGRVESQDGLKRKLVVRRKINVNSNFSELDKNRH